MKKYINRIISVIILISIVISNLPLGGIIAHIVKPSIALSKPSKATVNAGSNVSYTVMYSDADEIYLSSSYVTLNGFTADIYISKNGDTRTINLSNIQGTNGSKSIAIKAKSAENDAGYASAVENSYSFNLVNNVQVSSGDLIKPSISVSSPSKNSVTSGSSISYTLTFTDNSGTVKVNTTPSHITLNGFTANVSVSNTSNKSVINLTNIQGNAGKKNISIKAGAAQDSAGNSTSALSGTVSFDLINNNQNDNNATNYVDNVRPSISISNPNNSKVYTGGTVTYTVSFTDNVAISKIDLTPAYVTLNGFRANVIVSGTGKTRMITLTNIQGNAGKKNISIKAGAAQDSAGNSTYSISKTGSFTLIEKTNIQSNVVSKPSTSNNNKTHTSINKNTHLVISTDISTIKASTVLKSTPKIIDSCDDNLNVLGDINKRVKSFSTWLSSKRQNTTYSVQNNYVAKDEKVTYFVDYYNGKEDVAKDVKIKITIPYNVDVLEINSNGYIETQTSKETVIVWDKKSINSKSRCRLQVKVKYLENVILEQSDKISEQFYVTLKTKYDSENTTSYLRQLFVDTNSNKKATVKKYLSSIDNTNSIRPDDKITRAELAKLLADSGVVEVKQGNADYKKFKDAEEIPSYARDAVSAIYSAGIIESFSDSEFKPNNPIVRDEFFKIVAKAAEYISNGKLKVQTSTFIYTDIVNDDDKTLSDNTNYIMELIRQNIIDKAESHPDKYILRKDAVEIINSLTFRGPYVKKIDNNTVKFVDINKDSKYFYNIIAAASTYTYNYSSTLEQQILEIN